MHPEGNNLNRSKLCRQNSIFRGLLLLAPKMKRVGEDNVAEEIVADPLFM